MPHLKTALNFIATLRSFFAQSSARGIYEADLSADGIGNHLGTFGRELGVTKTTLMALSLACSIRC